MLESSDSNYVDFCRFLTIQFRFVVIKCLSPLSLLQVETLSEMASESLPPQPLPPLREHDNSSELAAANVTAETLKLDDTYWAPLLLQLLALIHFFLSAILIASYWYFKVCT